MLNTIIIYTFITAIIAMIIAAVVKLKKDQIRAERDYWMHECAIREREAQFFAEMDERLVPRIMNRFGQDMQDYLIDRHLQQRFVDVFGEQVIEHDEPANRFVLGSRSEDDPIVGYNLTEPNPAIRQSDVERLRQKEAQKNQQSKPAKSKLASEYFPQSKNHTEEKVFFQHDLMESDFWEDPTIWENQAETKGLLVSEPRVSQTSVTTKGRPKIHANAAAKQRAYRERMKQCSSVTVAHT